MFWAAETEQVVAETNRRPLQTVLKKKGKKCCLNHQY